MADAPSSPIDPRRPGPAGNVRTCQGHPYSCDSTPGVDVRFDPLTQKYLCGECWARVNPVTFGQPRR